MASMMVAARIAQVTKYIFKRLLLSWMALCVVQCAIAFFLFASHAPCGIAEMQAEVSCRQGLWVFGGPSDALWIGLINLLVSLVLTMCWWSLRRRASHRNRHAP